MSIYKSKIKANTYRDSVLLMRISTELRKLPGVEKCEVMVGTEQNKKSFLRSGLLSHEIQDAGPCDLVIAISGDSRESVNFALKKADELLESVGRPIIKERDLVFDSFSAAIEKVPKANLALISIPGAFVKREAMKALRAGLNLLIFSDNVPIEDELLIKRFAIKEGLLVMGPDCGTAIINGVSLAFANKVRRGDIGIVGATGTGIQEISSIIHNLGKGISHAIGTGSNDVGQIIGGITMIDGIRRLEADPSTRVLVVVSKPPAPETLEKILQVLKECKKPIFVNFLGADKEAIHICGAQFAVTLEELAVNASTNSNLTSKAFAESDTEYLRELTRRECNDLSEKQKYIRGLYSGGTLAIEACILMLKSIDNVYSNVSLKGVIPLDNPQVSRGHTVIDLGADEFTVGKPHPMLEPEMRHERILQEAADPNTAVILMDFVLGYGVHPDPVGAILPALNSAKRIAGKRNCHLSIVASVCGTDLDPQNRSEQIRKLKGIGAVVMPNNAQAVNIAKAIALRSLTSKEGER